LPNPAALAEVKERIKQAGVEYKEKEGVVFLRDPARNGVVLTTDQDAETIAVLAEFAQS
jgi:hypothetical protein